MWKSGYAIWEREYVNTFINTEDVSWVAGLSTWSRTQLPIHWQNVVAICVPDHLWCVIRSHRVRTSVIRAVHLWSLETHVIAKYEPDHSKCVGAVMLHNDLVVIPRLRVSAMQWLQFLIISHTFHKGETSELWGEEVIATHFTQHCSSLPSCSVSKQQTANFCFSSSPPPILLSHGSSSLQGAGQASSSNTLGTVTGSGLHF